MSTPDVPHRIEATSDVEGTIEQVWRAIATGPGISAWFLPTELEERVGGQIVFRAGESSSSGEITTFEPPHRLAYQESDWATLVGEDPASVSPLVTEFIIEATSGGTCSVRVVSSAFGSGADWEREFFDQMSDGWAPFLENLRVYLRDYAGRPVTHLEVEAAIEGEADEVWSALRSMLGAGSEGSPFALQGLEGTIQRITPSELLIRLGGPLPGHLMVGRNATRNGRTLVRVVGYLFADDADAYVEAHRMAWQEHLTSLA